MIVFKHLLLLALLPLPLLLYWLLPALRQRTLAVRIPFFELVAAATGAKVGSGSQVYQKPWLDIVLASLLWILLVAALAHPVKLGEPITENIVSRDIMLAIDLSGSMEEKDFPDEEGNRLVRLDAVKQVVSQYIRDRQQDRIGLIVFGTRAYLQVPFTQDLASAEQILDDMTVAMAGPHTAIGDAIGLAIKHFESSSVENKLLILLTDGADTGSRMSPKNAAHIAADEGLRIFTIGIGDEQGQGQYRVDFKTLRDIADITGAQFYPAEDSEALQKVYQQIDQVAASQLESTVVRAETSMVPLLLRFALAVIVLAFVIGALRTFLVGGRHA